MVSSLKPLYKQWYSSYNWLYITYLLFACTLNAVNWSLLKLSHVVDLCQRKLLFKGKLSMSFSGSSRICCWQFAKKTCLFSILFQSRIGFLVKDLWRNERNTQNLPRPIWEDSKSLQYSWGEIWFPLVPLTCSFFFAILWRAPSISQVVLDLVGEWLGCVPQFYPFLPFFDCEDRVLNYCRSFVATLWLARHYFSFIAWLL